MTTSDETTNPKMDIMAIVTAAIETASAEGCVEGYAKGASSDEAKQKLEELRKSYVEQGREAEREAAQSLVDEAREQGRLIGVQQAADEWRSKLDKRSHHKGVLEGKEIGYKEGFDAGKEEGFKVGFKACQIENAD